MPLIIAVLFLMHMQDGSYKVFSTPPAYTSMADCEADIKPVKEKLASGEHLMVNTSAGPAEVMALKCSPVGQTA